MIVRSPETVVFRPSAAAAEIAPVVESMNSTPVIALTPLLISELRTSLSFVPAPPSIVTLAFRFSAVISVPLAL